MLLPRGVAFFGVHRDSVSLIYRGSEHAAFTVRAVGKNEFSGLEFVRLPEYSSQTAIIQNNPPGDVIIHHCRFDMSEVFCTPDGLHEVFENEFIVRDPAAIGTLSGIVRIHHNLFVTAGPPYQPLYGIRIAEDGDFQIDHNVFDFRSARGKGDPIFVDRFPTRTVVRNNLFLGGRRGITWSAHDGVIENNTIVEPSTIEDGGVRITSIQIGDTVVIRNNSLVDFTSVPAFGSLIGGRVEYAYNALWPIVDSFYAQLFGDLSRLEIVDSANFIGYPMFVDDSLFRLQLGSPLIDAGDSSILDPDGSRSDIGWTGGPDGIIYEYIDLPPLRPDTLAVSGADTVVSVRWSARPEGDLAGYRLYRGHASGFWTPGSQPTYEFDPDVTDTLDQVSREADTLYYVVTSIDLAGQESDPSPEARHIISENPLNRPPSWVPINPQEIAEGDTLRLPVTASDPDGDSLILSAASLPANASFTDSGNGAGLLEFRPDTTQAGEYGIELIAQDGQLSDTTVANIFVSDNPSNRPPSWVPIATQQVIEGDTLRLRVSAIDPDADPLILSAVSLPANASFTDSGNGAGLLEFGPDTTQAGEYGIELIAQDGQLSDTTIANIVVSDNPSNRPPSWVPITPQEMAEGDTLRLRVTASDPDGDSLILSAVSLPANASFTDSGNSAGLLEFRPDTTQAGEYEIELIAQDGQLSDTTVANIVVLDRSMPPIPASGIVKVYPNPLNSRGSVEVSVPGGAVKLVLHDVLGRDVAVCYEGSLPVGTHHLEIDLSERALGIDLASGIYFLRLQVQGTTIGKLVKIAVIK